MTEEQKSFKQIVEYRKEKLEKLISKGVNPYPALFKPTHKSSKNNQSDVEKVVKKTMESVSSSEHHMFTIPLDVNINSGNNWEEAH